jgi:uncharacterized protein (DUF4415 family)
MSKKPLIDEEGEVRELTREDIRAMRPAQEVLPKELLTTLRKRGERGVQVRPTKLSVTVRYSREVLEYFKATGPGWQTRMDEVLKKWVARQRS